MRPIVHAVGAILISAVAAGTPAWAQGKTDVATLGNGDRITGEVTRLERGRLEFSTDDAGTLYLEWEKLAGLVATTRVVEVVTTDGRRFVGTLTAAQPRWIAVSESGGATALAMSDVALITPIGRSFWRKLDGTFDAGFSYSRSSGVAQLNLNWETVYRRPAFAARLTASLTQTQTDDEEGTDDRSSVAASYLRYPWQKWFVSVIGGFETNESLGLELRSQITAAIGPRLLNTTRSQLTLGAGLGVNDERGVDVESTRNFEGLLTFRSAYFTYDRPRTTLDIALEYYPSFSNPGRQRVQFDARVKQEVWKDLFLSLDVYNTFDSRPPNPSADRNDVGVLTAIGWTY
jgi:hypothetical protein